MKPRTRRGHHARLGCVVTIAIILLQSLAGLLFAASALMLIGGDAATGLRCGRIAFALLAAICFAFVVADTLKPNSRAAVDALLDLL